MIYRQVGTTLRCKSEFVYLGIKLFADDMAAVKRARIHSIQDMPAERPLMLSTHADYEKGGTCGTFEGFFIQLVVPYFLMAAKDFWGPEVIGT